MTNRKFDIIVDSACDMPVEYLEKHDVVCVKLGFTMNNVFRKRQPDEKRMRQQKQR